MILLYIYSGRRVTCCGSFFVASRSARTKISWTQKLQAMRANVASVCRERDGTERRVCVGAQALQWRRRRRTREVKPRATHRLLAEPLTLLDLGSFLLSSLFFPCCDRSGRSSTTRTAPWGCPGRRTRTCSSPATRTSGSSRTRPGRWWG